MQLIENIGVTFTQESLDETRSVGIIEIKPKEIQVFDNNIVYDRVLSGYINRLAKNKISYCYLDLYDNKVAHYSQKLEVKNEYINIYFQYLSL